MVGPVELMVLAFPTQRADRAVVDAVGEVLEHGDVTLLDLVYLARSPGGGTRLVDADDQLDHYGLGRLTVAAHPLISDDDLQVIQDGLDPETSAVVLAYEHTWSSRVGRTLEAAGGHVALHVQVPRDAVDEAFSALHTRRRSARVVAMARARSDRPGLLGTISRSHVVVGTASMIVSAINNHARRRAAELTAYSVQPTHVSAPHAAGVVEPETLVARLEHLARLHDAGALTDREFDCAKSIVLDS